MRASPGRFDLRRAAPTKTEPRRVVDLALTAFIFAVLAAGVRRPFLWVLAYVYIDILAPQKISWMLLTHLPISLIAFALAFAGWAYMDGKKGSRFKVPPDFSGGAALKTATYIASAGESLASIASGLATNLAGLSGYSVGADGEKIVVNIHTARPGILIGKRGAEVETLRKELAQFKFMKQRVLAMKQVAPTALQMAQAQQ